MQLFGPVGKREVKLEREQNQTTQRKPLIASLVCTQREMCVAQHLKSWSRGPLYRGKRSWPFDSSLSYKKR